MEVLVAVAVPVLVVLIRPGEARNIRPFSAFEVLQAPPSVCVNDVAE